MEISGTPKLDSSGNVIPNSIVLDVKHDYVSWIEKSKKDDQYYLSIQDGVRITASKLSIKELMNLKLFYKES